MEKAHIATAKGYNLPLSRKVCIELANFIRGKDIEKVKKLLDGVLKKTTAVPFKRFNKDRGHKKGIGPGRYPEKATNYVLKLIKSAEANAQNKGLNTSNLVLSSIVVNKGSTQWRYGRQRRRQMKRAHVEVTLTEKEIKKEEKPKAEKK